MSRKDDILDAAVILFAKNGYFATPTSAVAKKAGVAEGLIFHHFKNKAGILTHIFAELSEVYLLEIEELIKKTETGLDALLAVVRFHFAFAENESTKFKVLSRDLPADFTSPDSEAGKLMAEHMTIALNQVKKCIEGMFGKSGDSTAGLKLYCFTLTAQIYGLSNLRLNL